MYEELTIDSILKNLPESIQADAADQTSALLQLHLSGPESGNWLIIFDQGKCSIEAGRADNPDLTFSLDSDLFKDLVSGQTHPMKAFMNGSLQVSGNIPLAMKIAGFFQPI